MPFLIEDETDVDPADYWKYADGDPPLPPPIEEFDEGGWRPQREPFWFLTFMHVLVIGLYIWTLWFICSNLTPLILPFVAICIFVVAKLTADWHTLYERNRRCL